MKKIIRTLKSESAFTLIEMMIVLVIISILLLIVLPNLTKNQEMASNKGCDATIELLKTQVVAYEIEHNKRPTSLNDLQTENYVKSVTCPDGTSLTLNGDEITRDE
ncbi:competence protein ComG [Salipaludibacillus neizhouensis]|uniref:ComG operon protein 3 n=1 Tax=Salipaludibacillus neizhouensis TaxID=885475 RepID=A0A3A9KLN0_9BACI|nr:competence type IV pilus major pilin ComGC [Salipaludibacillus neizhouensis]RKL68745.1 competence protein ComG [Salipaludibacillus neizhouensis]